MPSLPEGNVLDPGYQRLQPSAAARASGISLVDRFNVANQGSDVYRNAEVIMKIDIDNPPRAVLVTFQTEGHPPVVGMLTRYNKKTVMVITDSGQHWNVAPGFLRKAAPTETTETSKAKVIQLRKE